MRVKIVLLILAIICFVFVNDLFSQIKAQQNSHRDVEPELTEGSRSFKSCYTTS